MNIVFNVWIIEDGSEDPSRPFCAFHYGHSVMSTSYAFPLVVFLLASFVLGVANFEEYEYFPLLREIHILEVLLDVLFQAAQLQTI